MSIRKKLIGILVTCFIVFLTAGISVPFVLNASGESSPAEFIIAGYEDGEYTYSYDHEGDMPWAYDISENCFHACATDAPMGYVVERLTFTTNGTFNANFKADFTDTRTYLEVEYDGNEEKKWSGVKSIEEKLSMTVEAGKTLTVTLAAYTSTDKSTASFTIDGYKPPVADYTMNETWFETPHLDYWEESQWSDELFYYDYDSNKWSGRVWGERDYNYVTMALVDISDTGLINFNVEAYLNGGAKLVIGAAKGSELKPLFTMSDDYYLYREINNDITIDAALIRALDCDTLVFELTFDADTFNNESDEYYYDSHAYISGLNEPEKGEVIRSESDPKYGIFDYNPDTGEYFFKYDSSCDDPIYLDFKAIKSGYITFTLDLNIYNIELDIYSGSDNYDGAYFNWSGREFEAAYDEGLYITGERKVSFYITEGNTFYFGICWYDEETYGTPDGQVIIKDLPTVALISASSNIPEGGSVQLNGGEAYDEFTKVSCSSQEGATLTAIPNDEYEFFYWYDVTNGEIVSYDRVYTIAHPQGDIEFIAYFGYHGVLETLNPGTEEQYWVKTTSDEGDVYSIDFSKYSSPLGWTGTMTFEFEGEKWIQFDYAYHSSNWNNIFSVLVDGVEQVKDTSYDSSIKDKTFKSKVIQALGDGYHTVTFQYHLERYDATYTHFCEIKNLRFSTSEDADARIEYTVEYDDSLGEVYLEGSLITPGQKLTALEGYYGHFEFIAKQGIDSTADPTRKTNAVFYCVRSGSGKNISTSNRGKESATATIKFTSVGISNGDYESEDPNLKVEFQEIMLPITQISLSKTVDGEEVESEELIKDGSEIHVPFAKSNLLAFTFEQFVPKADVEVKYYVSVNGKSIASNSTEGGSGELVGNTRGFALEDISVDTKVVVSTSASNYYGTATLTFNIIIDEPGTSQQLAGLENLKTAESESFTIVQDSVNRWAFSPDRSTSETIVYKAFSGKDTVSQLKFELPAQGSLTFEVYTWGYVSKSYGDNYELRYSRLFASFQGRIPTNADGTASVDYMRENYINPYFTKGQFLRLVEGNDSGYYNEDDRVAPYCNPDYATLLDDGWVRVQIPVSAKSTLWLAYYCDKTLSDPQCYIRNIGFYTGSAEVTFEVKDYQSTSSGAKISAVSGSTAVTSGSNVTMGNRVTLTLNNLGSNQFYGWVMNDKLMSTATTWSYTVSKNNATVYAWVAPKGTYVARNEGKFYASAEEACEKASSGETVYIIKKEGGEITRSFTIPVGVNLVLPMNDAGKYFVQAGTTTNQMAWYGANEAKYRYATFTIANGATVTVLGNFYIGGTLHRNDRSAQAHTSGAYSHLINNGKIEIKDGGIMDVYGRVTGTGEINVLNGGYLYQPFLILDYAGGSNTQDLFNQKQVPFNRYAMINIECTFTVYYGGVLYGHASLYFWSSIHTLDEPFISYANAKNYSDRDAILILEEGSYARMEYDPEKVIETIHNPLADTVGTAECRGTESVGLTKMTLHGGARLKYMKFPLGINTSEVAFAIPYNFDVTLESGNFNIDYSYKLMPGARLTVAEGATLNINANFYVYDGLIQHTMSGGIYPQVKDLTDAGYSATANFIVNGKVILKSGITFLGVIQTTGTSGEIVVEDDVTLSATIIDGGRGTYDCNYSEFASSARVWDAVHGKLALLEAGHSYKATGSPEFTLPALSIKFEAGSHTSGSTHKDLKTVTLDAVKGLRGSWMIVHETHEYPGWEEYNPTADSPIQEVNGTCTALGCGETESSYLLYVPENLGSLVFRNSAFTAGDIENLFKAYYKTLADTVGVSAALSAASPLNAGDYRVTITLTGAYFKTSAGYTHEHTFSWTISPAEIDTLEVLGDYTYNGQAQTPEVVVKAGELTLNAGEYEVTATDNTNAGEATVTVTVTANNYTGTITKQFTIKKKQITVRAENQTKTYDGEEGVLSEDKWTYSPGDLCGGDGKEVLNVTLTLGDGEHKNANTYEITGTGTAANYEITVKSGTYTIEKKQITVQAEAKRSTYGDGLQELTWTVAEGQLAKGDDKDVLSVTLTLGEGEHKNAGEYTITGTGTAANYEITVENGTYTIGKKQITVQAEAKRSTYGDELQELTWTIAEGQLVEGDEETVLEITLKRNSTSLTAGTYTGDIVKDTAKSDNYEITVTPGTYTIDKKPITIELEDQTAVYNGGEQSASSDKQYWTVNEQLAYSDTVDDLKVSLTATGRDVTSYEITGSITNENYSATFGEASFEITALSITGGDVTGIDSEVTYKGAAWEFEISVEVNGLSADIDVAYADNLKAGAPNQATVTITGKENFCGEIVEHFTINKKSITVTISNQTKTYDGKAGEITPDAWTHESLCGNDAKESLGVTLTGQIGKDAGEYHITGAGQSENYAVTFRGETGQEYGIYTIEKAEATLTINNVEREYGEANRLSFTVTGLVAGENIDEAITPTTSATEKSDVGDYDIDVKIDEAHAVAKNYKVTWTKGKLTVTARKITIKISDRTAAYTGSKPEVSSEAGDYEVTSEKQIVSGDDLRIKLYIEAQESYHQGRYTIKGVAEAEIAKNYAITWTDGRFTITPKDITLTLRPQSAVYTGKQPEIDSGMWSDNHNGIVNGDGLDITLTVEGTGEWNVGKYTIKGVAGNEDYNVTFENGENAFTITPKDIEGAQVKITTPADDIIYTGKAVTVNYTITLEGFESVTVSASYTKNTLAGEATLKLTGTDNFSGEVTQTFIIKPKDISGATVTVTEPEGGFVYNNSDWTPAVTVTLEDYGEITFNKTYQDNKAAGRATVRVEGTVNYTGTAEATFEIAKKEITVTATNLSSAYGEELQALKFKTDGLLDDGNDVEQHIKIESEVQKDSDVGGYTITVAFEDGYTPANYTAKFVSGTYTITDAEFKGVAFVGSECTYDGELHSLTVTGAPDGAHITYESGGKEFTGATAAGSYEITATITLENYKEQSLTATLKINKKQITVTISAQESDYSGEEPEVSQDKWEVKDNGLCKNDGKTVLGVELKKEAGVNCRPGGYKITGSYKSENYEVTFEDGTYTIKPLKVTVEILPQTWTYSKGKPTIGSEEKNWRVTAGEVLQGESLNITLSVKDSETWDVGSYEICGAYDNANYTVTFESGANALTIAAKAITVTIHDQSSTYNGREPEVSQDKDKYSVEAGGLCQGDELKVTLTKAAGKDYKADGYEITGESANANYEVTWVKGTYRINKKAIEVTLESQQAGYNGQKPEVTQTKWTAPKGAVEGEDDLKLTLYIKEQVTKYNAGTYHITAVCGNENYSVSFTDGEYTITKRNITVDIADKQVVYTGKAPVLGSEEHTDWSVTSGEVVDGDSLGVSLTLQSAEKYIVGEYTIDGTWTEKTNYDVTFETGKLTIEKKSITVKIGKSGDVSYNGGKPDIADNIWTPEGLADGDGKESLGVTLYVVAKGDKWNVGTYEIDGTATAHDYEVSFEKGSVTVTKAMVTVDIKKHTATYSGEAPKFTAVRDTDWSVTDGTIYGDDDLGITLYTDKVHFGTYTLDRKSTNENYEVKFTGGALEITAKKIQVSITPQSSTYGDAITVDQKAYAATGAVESDDLQITLTKADGNAAGKYDITGKSANNDYEIEFTGGTNAYTIEKREIEVTILNQESVYGDEITLNQKSWQAEEGGIIGNDDLKITLTKADGTEVREGGYKISGSYTNANYSVTFKEGTYTITPRPVTVTPNGGESEYNGEEPELTQSAWRVTKGNIVNDDDLEITLTLGDGDHSDVNSYDITGSAANGNYTVTFEKATFEVTRRNINVTLKEQTCEYSGEEPVLDQSLWQDDGRLIEGDLLNISLTKDEGVIVGVYAIHATYNNANYNVVFTQGQFRITKKHITVTINNQTSEYAGSEPGLSQTGWDANGGVVKDDVLGVELTKQAGYTVGDYKITGKYTNTNYEVEWQDGTFTITPKKITITIQDQTSVYDGQQPAITQNLYSDAGGIESVDERNVVLGIVAKDNWDAGDYEITGTFENANYEVTWVKGTFKITKRDITVTIQNQTAVYSGEEPNVVQTLWTSENEVAGDNLQITLTKESGVNAGEYEIDGVCGNGNYNAAFTKGTFTITKLDIGDTIILAGENDNGTIVLEYTGEDITLTAFAQASVEILLDPAKVKDVGSYQVTATVQDINYTGSKQFTVVVKLSKYSEALVEALRHLEETVGELTVEELTADDFEIIKEIAVTLASLSEEEKSFAAEDLARYTALLDAWNTDVDEQVINTAHMVADTVISHLFAISALATVAYVLLRRKF